MAIETADVTLMNDDLSRVVDFMLMSRAVLRRIKLNIFFSIICNAVGDDQGIDRCRPHRRRSVDENDIKVRQNRFQLPAKEQLAIHLFRLKKVVGFDVDGVGQEMQLRADLDQVASDLGRLVDQQAMGSQPELVQVDTEAGAQITLLVQIDGEGSVAGPGKANSKIQDDCGLAAASPRVGGRAMSAKT